MFVHSPTPPSETPGPDAVTFAFAGRRLLVSIRDARAALCAPAPTGVVRSLYLGSLDGRPCYVVEIPEPAGETPAAAAIPAGAMPAVDSPVFRDLRSLLGLLDEETMRVAGVASQVLDWDRNHQFCGRCGTQTNRSRSERSRVCPACGLSVFPRISPAIIVAVLKGKEILLAHNRRHQAPVYSIIAGFVEPGENLEECVRREIAEEVAIQVGEIRYYASQPWPFPDSLMIGFTAEYRGGEIRPDGVEILEAGWFSKENLPQIPPHGTIARKIIDAVL